MVKEEGQLVMFRRCRIMERRKGQGNCKEGKGQVVFIDKCKGKSMGYARMQQDFPY